ncbi:MAG: metal ABC transporter permease [Deltaproteobacteria bacterium]|nr:metal ABC transporter permease [Deltaproteobacteria bacterium]
MLDMLQYEFARNAIMTGLLASIACGIIGSYVVIKRIVFISGGMAHTAFGGIGLGYYLGINPIVGAAFFSIGSALALGIITKKTDQREDAVVGVLWAIGVALGIIFIALTPGYAPDLMSYLFGDILMVPFYDIILILALDSIIVFVVLLLYKEFLALCFDEEFTEVTGIPTLSLYLILLCLIAMTIVILIRVVGIILVIALLTMPAAISSQFTYNLKKIMIISILLGIVFTTSGIMASYYFDLPSGATIILVSGTIYVLTLLYKKVLYRKDYQMEGR